METPPILLVIAWCSILYTGYCETETDRAIAKLRIEYSTPDRIDLGKILERAFVKKNPRIFELQRRIGAEGDTFGALKAPAELLDSQIDALLLQKPESFANGIVAARVVWYFRNVPEQIVYWHRDDATAQMSKSAWLRKNPEPPIDICMPLPEWDEDRKFPRVSIDECQMLNPFFDDPMPPTILPPVARVVLHELHLAVRGRVHLLYRHPHQPA